MPIPENRLTDLNRAPENANGDYVLYWMIANRRLSWNFALDHSIDLAKKFGKPLLIFEPLRTRYRWASDRLHHFVISGMPDHAAQLEGKSVGYYPYVEPSPGKGMPLLHELAKTACVVVTDDYPCFFLPHMIDTVKNRLPVRFQQVDSNGIIPLRLPDRTFTVAHSYRRWMQKNILDVILECPQASPLSRLKLPTFSGVNPKILKRWPAADFASLLQHDGLAKIPIDHSVTPTDATIGGPMQAETKLKRFLDKRLAAYDEARNHPDEHATSGLSPYLHFGHLSSHEIVTRVLDHESWTPDKAAAPNGKNLGFWNTSKTAEAFLDQILTWREMGFNLCHREPENYDKFESLPD